MDGSPEVFIMPLEKAESTDVNSGCYEIRNGSGDRMADGPLPLDPVESDTKHFKILCDVLDQCVEYNDAHQIRRHRKSRFEGRKIEMKASRYLQRMLKYSGASPCCFITALVYMERFKVVHPTLVLNSKSLQRLLLVPVMLATKYLEDHFCNNSCWAEIAGLPLRELNTLEIEFLVGIEFNLSVQPEDYARRTQDLDRFDTQRRAPRQPDSCERVTVAIQRLDHLSVSFSHRGDCNRHLGRANLEPDSSAAGLMEAAAGLRIAGAGRESAAAAKVARAVAAAAYSGKSPTPDGPASPGPPVVL